jgi:uncharacterized protein
MISALSNVVKRHSLLAFFGLAYGLSWLGNLIEPHSLFPFGPLLAALIMAGLAGGLREVKTFLNRIGQWRVGLRWYTLVLGLPVVITLVAVGLNLLLGAVMSTTAQFPTGPDLVTRFIFLFFFIGLGEEPAWRGYALPRLLVGRSALAASLLLGLLHIGWHLPLFGLEFDLQNGLPWALGLSAFAVLTTWVYKHTQGSLLIPTLFHTTVNTINFFFGMFSDGDLVRLWWLWGSLWVVAAVIVVLVSGPSLVRRSTQPELIREPVAGI